VSIADAAPDHWIGGDEPVHRGKVKLEVPPLVENGNTVAFTVSVDSPMTEKEHIKSIHIG
jgi:sulfur-oxidizing protein SoxY